MSDADAHVDAFADIADLPFETLALGLEQPFRVILVLGILEHEERLLSRNKVRTYGHSVRDLLDSVLELAERPAMEGSDRRSDRIFGSCVKTPCWDILSTG